MKDYMANIAIPALFSRLDAKTGTILPCYDGTGYNMFCCRTNCMAIQELQAIENRTFWNFKDRQHFFASKR
jgi:hypothetical protein